LQVVKVGQRPLVSRSGRRRISKAGVLSALAGRQAIRTGSIVRSEPGKVLVVDLGLARRWALAASACPTQGRRRARGRLRCRRGSRSRLLLSSDVLATLDLARQSFLPLLAHLAAVSLGNGRIVPGDTPHLRVLVLLEEFAPVLVAAQSHTLDLARLEGIHGDATHKGDVDTQATVYARARQADEDAELGRRPLRRGRIAVAADVVLGFLLESGQLP
jgi:hypothetical protein